MISEAPPPAPLLTPAVVRRLLHRSQVQVAAAAGVSIGTVRLYEAADRAVRDPEKRQALARVYSGLRDELLSRPAASP